MRHFQITKDWIKHNLFRVSTFSETKARLRFADDRNKVAKLGNYEGRNLWCSV